jgi:hypothetical protein
MATDHTEVETKVALDGLRTYLEGKIKRLELMFAVNGGAFVIGKLRWELKSESGTPTEMIPIQFLAGGAIIFTVVMIMDTWLWADMMKKDYVHKRGFTLAGQLILGSLGLLIIAAWSYVGFYWPWPCVFYTVGWLVAMYVEKRRFPWHFPWQKGKPDSDTTESQPHEKVITA